MCKESLKCKKRPDGASNSPNLCLKNCCEQTLTCNFQNIYVAMSVVAAEMFLKVGAAFIDVLVFNDTTTTAIEQVMSTSEGTLSASAVSTVFVMTDVLSLRAKIQ